MTQAERAKLFGAFKYTPAPTDSNPEAIRVDPAWVRENIVSVSLEPLTLGRPGFPKFASFHKLVEPRFLELCAAWRAADLLGDVLHFGGGYSARFIRGSTKNLSAHSYGSAFDINVRWNRLGTPGAKLGELGSVVRLVPTARRLGWMWGGDFTRKDGMHFELARV